MIPLNVYKIVMTSRSMPVTVGYLTVPDTSENAIDFLGRLYVRCELLVQIHVNLWGFIPDWLLVAHL